MKKLMGRDKNGEVTFSEVILLLEGSCKGHQVQLLAPHRSTQKFRPMTESTVQIPSQKPPQSSRVPCSLRPQPLAGMRGGLCPVPAAGGGDGGGLRFTASRQHVEMGQGAEGPGELNSIGVPTAS